MLLVSGPSCRYLGLIFGASHLEAAQLFKQTHYLLMFTCSLLVLTMRTPFASSLYTQNDSPVNGNTRVVAMHTNPYLQWADWISWRGCAVVGQNANSSKSIFWWFSRYRLACDGNRLCKCLFNFGTGVQGVSRSPRHAFSGTSRLL